ncbi:MAG TPA: CocE/NonD family hydrolase [Bacteroidota bacterium]|nr:CocE/NonD family hydrolase [Bacteroidota bacterium]
MKLFNRTVLSLFLVITMLSSQEQFDVKAHYIKKEVMIPMRDGVRLFTAIYIPKDTTRLYPIMVNRTPYSVSPYGEENFRPVLGPSQWFDRDGFIFVHQDIRGKFKSEGVYLYHSPIVPKKSNKDVDHSTDTYDTIDWLIKNVPRNNGRVGVWGISYPGFLAAMSLVDAHPALKAVSPQAPMGDTFIGDDFHHNGAFFLMHAFGWLSGTAPARSNREASVKRPPGFDYGTPDGYRFFLELGPIANVDKKYFQGQVPVWTDFMKHGTYDEYWKVRNVPQHMKNIKPAVMTTAGWFDSEDPWGAVNIYNAIEKNNPNTFNMIVWGPWLHGGWARMDGDTLGYAHFKVKTSLWYRENVEFPFFTYYLKDKGPKNFPETWAFMTGGNEWRSYSAWPPKEAKVKNLYLHANGKASFSRPTEKGNQYDEYVSDPMKPVPFSAETTTRMGHLFMVEDQRFAYSRPDVLVYETDVLQEDVTIAGPIEVNLYGSTSGTDCDWIVKLIDVLPPDTPDPDPNPAGVRMGHFQMLIGGEVMRSKFRNNLEKPEPMTPNKVTQIVFNIPDKHHRFKKGHRIMVQIQSTWFPLVDRNPGKFVDIYNAKESDFQKTTQRVYRSGENSSFLKFLVVE